MVTTALISHSDCLAHEMQSGHPESPARLQAIDSQLLISGLESLCRHYDAPLVTEEQLARVHDPRYLQMLETASPASGLVALDPDTMLNPHTLQAAKRAAGAVVHATDRVMAGEVRNVFCPVRPPGHHAEHGHAMGFCFYNNVAVGAAHALESHGLERVAVVDFDVHHGNGTEEIFHDEPRVLFCSTFQHPFYPFSDPVSDRSHIVKCPLPAGSGSEAFRQAVTEQWLPALESFAPQMIFVSAGFDAHREDALANLNLIEADYRWVTEEIVAIAGRHAEGRIVSVLEGGYNTVALASSVIAHIEALAA